MKSTIKEKPRALLVAIKTPKVSDIDSEESLHELERLVTTLGFDVVAKEFQKRPNTKNITVVGEGKLKHLAEYTGGPGIVERGNFAKKSKAALKIEEEKNVDEAFEADSLDPDLDIIDLPKADIVVFDCDLSPAQMRNLESALGVEILDRSGVIIEIFSRHARTRAAKLQVEIARLKYLAPRLRETGGGSERQAGRGSGESSLELDRRNIRDRVTELKTELLQVQKEQEGRRSVRSDQLSVALIGYTNAGKSSTMRALTGSEVLVEDKLFATLDTTVRALHPETHPRILISDTVGFIKKLPHDLVASFKSTLDEALNAFLLLYVVDASDPNYPSQLEITKEVLSQVGVKNTQSYIIFNKSDRLTEEEKTSLKENFPQAIVMSSRNPDDIKKLREIILSAFEKDMLEEDVFAAYNVTGIVGDIRSNMRVIKESYENLGVRLRVRARPADLHRLKKKYHLT
ncbi:GTPase HflX [bacterium]|nr:GTPase HflX [bacterium]